MAIRVWGDKLVVVNLPSDSLEDLPKLKRVGGDQFRRLTKEGDERENWIFERSDDGQIIGIRRHSMTLIRVL